jgi:predicted HAD superfamily Cof-like phosphohydrolase
MPTRLRSQVVNFMVRFVHPVKARPAKPDLSRIKLRARLIAEEAVETVQAMTDTDRADHGLTFDNVGQFIERYHPKDEPLSLYSAALALLNGAFDTMSPDTDYTLDQMVQVADGMADLDYVVEGTRLEYGIDGEPIAELVHAANMLKIPDVDAHGKTKKPEGWVPPDSAIGTELTRQGFRRA